MSEWTFRVHVPGEPPHEVEVVDGLTLGRHPESGCVLKDPRISAQHARVLREGDAFLIEDVGSSNKTRIEGGPALAQGERWKLETGMEIVLGDTRIEVAGPVSIPSTIVEGVEGVEGVEEVGEVEGTLLGGSAPPAKASAPADAPPSTEAVPAAESGAVPAVPAEQSAEAELDDSSGYMGTVMGVEAPMGELARIEALKVARPRLVIVNEAFGGIVDIEKDVFLIGRRKKDHPDLLIDDRALSGRHAEIKYDGRRFFLTDLNSTNYTYIGDERLAGGSPREIKSDTRIRFGSVEAVFFTDQDSEGRDIPHERYSAALEYLVNQERITASQRSQAQRQAGEEGRNAGEILLAAGNVITAADWVEAIDRGRMIRTLQASGGKSSSSRMLVLGITVVALLALVAYLVFEALS